MPRLRAPLSLHVGLAILGGVLAACRPGAPAPGAAPAPRPLAPLTRAERTNYSETSSHADVLTFLDSLVTLGAPITVTDLATSPMGKRVPLVIAARPRVTTVAEARALGRPVAYIQANIHAGEVEGKEAMLALLRDWSFAPQPTVLDSLVLVVVPIYNADGNDRLAPQERNRGAQNGPEQIGERPNGMGLDLNRDYVKAEAPETRGALAALTAWAPDLFMDLHTTNGSYHGYALTYAPSLHPAAPLGSFMHDTLLPVIRDRVRARHGFALFPYGNFTAAGGRESLTAAEKSGWRTYEHTQRYGTNYVGLRGGLSILSEAYSHDPFARRVASTRAFVQELLSYVAEQPAAIRARVAAGRSAAVFGGAPRAPLAVRGRFTSAPDTQPVLVERLDRVADTTARTEPGVPKGIRRSGVITPQRMPVIDRFEAALRRDPAPAGYVFDARWTEVAERLRVHGIAVGTLNAPQQLSLQEFVVDTVIAAGRPFQGHREVRVDGRWRGASRELPAGTFVVRTGQSLDLLAMLLLEPESDDGLLTWNFFDAALTAGTSAPVARLVAPPR